MLLSGPRCCPYRTTSCDVIISLTFIGSSVGSIAYKSAMTPETCGAARIGIIDSGINTIRSLPPRAVIVTDFPQLKGFIELLIYSTKPFSGKKAKLSSAMALHQVFIYANKTPLFRCFLQLFQVSHYLMEFAQTW